MQSLKCILFLLLSVPTCASIFAQVDSIALRHAPLNLAEVVVTGKESRQETTISNIDLQLRPANSSQDLLRFVPGLFIAQHAGGGKAEQIFLRGFDVDHGTDFAITVDGIPVNMPSHAHGQGYADLHFLIPETVHELEVNKGPYSAKNGDMATSGAGEFRTLNTPARNQIKLEYGMFNTRRALAMLKLPDTTHILSKRKESLYVAGEYKLTDSYFASKQNFSRSNLFIKYHGVQNNLALLTLSASTFHSRWNASGQIPERKVKDGTIGSFGSIDPTEGGLTSRTNFNAVYAIPLSNGSFRQQAYYSRYDFELFSNFTFFLHDSVLGDQIRQRDHRDILGYATSLNTEHRVFGKALLSSVGGGARYDKADISLTHAVQRKHVSDIITGRLNQLNIWAYADENYNFSQRLRVNMGVRADWYRFGFENHTFDTASGMATKSVVSPKLSAYYSINKATQLFVKSGYGFHSNDARAVVVGKLQSTLPRAFGYEIGSIFKLNTRSVFNVALWGLDLESELVYVGDEAIVEASGRSRRLGIDLGMRYQVATKLYFDADLNLNSARLLDEPDGANHIPLAPTLTSTGGLSYRQNSGLNCSLRYRYMHDRAANENYSLTASGYILADASVSYSFSRYEIIVSAENLLNVEWKEAQFATESRLRDETQPVNEIHYTPGTPRFIKLSVACSF